MIYSACSQLSQVRHDSQSCYHLDILFAIITEEIDGKYLTAQTRFERFNLLAL